MGHYFFSVIAHRHSLLITFLLFMCLVRGGALLQHSEVASEEVEGFKGKKGTAAVEGSKIGSRPPRCVGICRECGRCEAVQVPAIPQQIRNAAGRRRYSADAAAVNSRGDYSSNYKPLSWKCKCGDVIVNP